MVADPRLPSTQSRDQSSTATVLVRRGLGQNEVSVVGRSSDVT